MQRRIDEIIMPFLGGPISLDSYTAMLESLTQSIPEIENWKIYMIGVDTAIGVVKVTADEQEYTVKSNGK